MKLPNAAHTSRPWRIHELTGDFRLEDVWALPEEGGPDDFPQVVQLLASFDPSKSSSVVVRTLFEIRWKLGALFGWDDAAVGAGAGAASLRDRLPADLRDASSGPDFGAAPFRPLYLLEDEFAAEIANRTMHGVLHVGWVPDDTGCFHGQLAVLVKPNGGLGNFYMAAIRPFRYLIVYPTMLREHERVWRQYSSPVTIPTTVRCTVPPSLPPNAGSEATRVSCRGDSDQNSPRFEHHPLRATPLRGDGARSNLAVQSRPSSSSKASRGLPAW